MGKSERLKSRKAIDLLFTQGKSFSIFPFRIVYQPGISAEAPYLLRTGFSASKKYFKKAVHRNRIKRLMREAYRLQKGSLEESLTGADKSLAIFILFTGKELPEYNLVAEKMTLILQRLQKLSNEQIAANT